ncbi:hypothetical protein [Hydrogenophaga sp.]|uniref:hypothetical protein n=1 Tax=Hydrogenophaga sp. TaxID=1904254 RepID=UPI00271E161F|nr:hypothetical protein [Hydrogenophaga sp.]MDO8906331.1 hypothetical protein [Hydrogenophaga sp.]
MTTSEDRKSFASRAGEQPFSPPAPRPFYPWMLLVLVLVAAAWFGFRSFQETSTLVPVAAPPAVPPVSPQLPTPDAAQAVVAPLSPSVPQTMAMKRCTLNGQVSYTDGDCPALAQVEAVNLMPNSGWTGSSSAGRTTIERCKTSDNRYFWSASPCRQRLAQVDRYATVSAGIPFEQQVHEAEEQRRAARPPSSAIAPSSVATATGSGAKARQCKALNDEIVHLDAWARQPLTAWQQDRIRERRKAARDQQFALKC